MPLTLTVTEGVLPKGTEKNTIKRLSEAFLRWHGLIGNKAMTPNVIGHINVLPLEHTYSGMQETPVALIEWKTPSFAFASREVQLGYVEEATNIVHEMSGGKQPKERIWVNVVHAVDGTWGINGKGFTNAELASVIGKG